MVFKKKHDGPKCSECWDEVLKRVTRSNCTVCAGTGVIGGYYTPIEGWMELDPDAKSASIQIQGIDQPELTRYSFTNYPLLRPGDIIVELKPNNFWKAVDVRFPQRNRVLFLQTGTVDKVNRSDIEYKAIQVPQDRRRALVALLDERVAGDPI